MAKPGPNPIGDAQDLPALEVPAEVIPNGIRADVETLWRYHDMRHELRPCDVGIGLGSHDLGVAVIATRLFHAGLYPWIVFTGANAPTTRAVPA
jgi:hypothetical protein